MFLFVVSWVGVWPPLSVLHGLLQGGIEEPLVFEKRDQLQNP